MRKIISLSAKIFLSKEKSLCRAKQCLCIPAGANTGAPMLTFEKPPVSHSRGSRDYLVSQHVKLVGIDSHNIDDTRSRTPDLFIHGIAQAMKFP